MYYKVVKPLNRGGFVDSKGLRCDGIGFIALLKDTDGLLKVKLNSFR